MKKAFLAFALTGLMLFSGCNVVEGVLNGDVVGTLLNTPDINVYEELSRLAGSPTNSTDLSSVKFVAEIASEPFELTIEEEKHMYQEVYICRAYDDPIFVNVNSIETPPAAGTYATITGRLDGSIYWTENNKREEVLDIRATAMEAFTVSESEPSTANKLSMKDGTYAGDIEFVGAHYSKNTFGSVIVVYYNFTNTAAETNVKFNGSSYMLGQFDVYHGDMFTESSNAFAPDELDSAALKAGDIQSYTPSGKTQLYYTAYKVVEDTEDVLAFALFDDEFTFTNLIELPIAASLAEMNQ